MGKHFIPTVIAAVARFYRRPLDSLKPVTIRRCALIRNRVCLKFSMPPRSNRFSIRNPLASLLATIVMAVTLADNNSFSPDNFRNVSGPLSSRYPQDEDQNPFGEIPDDGNPDIQPPVDLRQPEDTLPKLPRAIPQSNPRQPQIDENPFGEIPGPDEDFETPRQISPDLNDIPDRPRDTDGTLQLPPGGEFTPEPGSIPDLPKFSLDDPTAGDSDDEVRPGDPDANGEFGDGGEQLSGTALQRRINDYINRSRNPEKQPLPDPRYYAGEPQPSPAAAVPPNPYAGLPGPYGYAGMANPYAFNPAMMAGGYAAMIPAGYPMMPGYGVATCGGCMPACGGGCGGGCGCNTCGSCQPAACQSTCGSGTSVLNAGDDYSGYASYDSCDPCQTEHLGCQGCDGGCSECGHASLASCGPINPSCATCYLSLFGGSSDLQDFRVNDDTTRADYFGDGGYGVGIAIGKLLGRNLRAEIEGSYRSNDIERLELFGGGDMLDAGLTGEFETFAGMGNVWWEFLNFPSQKLKPYVGTGVGFITARSDFQLTGGDAVETNDDDSSFAYQWIAGVNFKAGPRTDVFAEYRYLRADSLRCRNRRSDDADRQRVRAV